MLARVVVFVPGRIVVRVVAFRRRLHPRAFNLATGYLSAVRQHRVVCTIAEAARI